MDNWITFESAVKETEGRKLYIKAKDICVVEQVNKNMTRIYITDGIGKLVKGDVDSVYQKVTFAQDPWSQIAAVATEMAGVEDEKEHETKNDGTEYCEQDQFVCHKCGIELQDWHRVERDPDDGDVTYHEYTLRYCPHCGRKIVEE